MKRLAILVAAALCAVLAGGATRIVQDQCGPFTDVTPAFCPYILELYYLGITAGTSATTFSPDDPLTRGQGAVFIAKGLNQSLARSSRRAALGQWWIPDANAVALSTAHPADTRCLPAIRRRGLVDPSELRPRGTSPVQRIYAGSTAGAARRAPWTLVAMGRVFVTGNLRPGRLYMIDPDSAFWAGHDGREQPRRQPGRNRVRRNEDLDGQLGRLRFDRDAGVYLRRGR